MRRAGLSERVLEVDLNWETILTQRPRVRPLMEWFGRRVLPFFGSLDSSDDLIQDLYLHGLLGRDLDFTLLDRPEENAPLWATLRLLTGSRR